MRFFSTRAPARRAQPESLAARATRQPGTSRYQHAYPACPQPAGWLVTLLLALLIAVALVGGAAMAARTYLASDRIVPNVAVRGLRLDGRTADAARTALEARYAAFLRTPVTFELAGRIWSPSAAELGLHLDLDGAAPLTLAAGAQTWAWTPAERAELLWVTPAGRSFRIAVDEALLAVRVAVLAPALVTPAVEPRLRFNGGQLAIIQPGRDGVQLDQALAVEQIADALLSGAAQVALPLTALLPQARPESLAALGIVERVAQGRSSFTGSPAYRATNIAAGARLMDGVLIPPGGEFSFNQHVGDIDESNGFVLGHAIIDGRTQLEWGGGVCQVSTTVFRAAFWGGVPITERNQHSFRISWYERFEPIGMDAAIFTGPGGYDLKFVNDTPNWLLMETVFDGAAETLTVNLYGTDDGREVEQIAPAITRRVAAPSAPRYVNDPGLPAGTLRQTDTSRDGMDVSVGRVVRRGDAVLTNDSFFSRFQAWPNIFVRGTGG